MAIRDQPRETPGPSDRAQAGFTMAAILLLLVVLTLLSSVALYNVKGDIHHTGMDLRRTKAQKVAEGATSWALDGLAMDKPDVLPFTAATHAGNGIDTLPDFLANGEVNPRKLHTDNVTRIYAGPVRKDSHGWLYQHTSHPDSSLSASSDETIAFKIWYPNDSTIRITGKGIVQGIEAEVEMTGSLKYQRVGL